MQLGAFSVSLGVKDIHASKAFYEKMGFTVFGGDADSNYFIMKNGNALIGLFQGMFEGNILTFNPGWDENALKVNGSDDIREILKALRDDGITVNGEIETSSGPGSFMVEDPDGNVILLDQHI